MTEPLRDPLLDPSHPEHASRALPSTEGAAKFANALRSLPTIDDCVHCGLCLEACPTYAVFGREVESPRGRIAALRKLSEGRPLTPALEEGLADCLICRACESACPSGISMESMVAGYRSGRQQKRPTWRDHLERWALDHVIPQPRTRRLVTHLTRWTRPIASALGFEVPDRSRLRPEDYETRPPRRARGTVALLRGCVGDEWFRRETMAAVRVLERNGWRVELPEVHCCGALHRHAGQVESADAWSVDTAERLLACRPDFVVSDTAGCTASLLEPHLAHPALSEVREKTTDTLGLLHREGYAAPAATIPGTWFVAPPCHHRHGPLSEEPTRALLDTVLAEGYRELPGPDHCCGAAGLYLARRPRTSRKVGDEAFARWEAATAHQPASGIVSGNAGCLMRWETLLREDSAEAVHPVVLLDRAYDAP